MDSDRSKRADREMKPIPDEPAPPPGEPPAADPGLGGAGPRTRPLEGDGPIDWRRLKECLGLILRRSLGRICEVRRNALADGMEDPAVAVLDLRVIDAQVVALALDPQAEVEGAMLEAGRRGKVPTLIVAVERQQLVELLSYATPIPMGRAEQHARPGHFLVAVVDSSVSSAMFVPVPA